MGRLDSLVAVKEAIVQQAAVQAQINQTDLLRRKYNEICLSDASLQAENGDLANEACHFVKGEYETAIEDLAILKQGDSPIYLCAEGGCPTAVADESN